MEPRATDSPVPREIDALLSEERSTLRETQRVVTRRSPNHIDPSVTFTAFLVSVLLGSRRFAHASWLRGDRALHALLGLDRFPTDDTIRNLFRRFGMVKCSADLSR